MSNYEKRLRNMDTATIEINRTVIPADGGMLKMTTTGQYSLGKTISQAILGKTGWVWVNPDYEKPKI